MTGDLVVVIVLHVVAWDFGLWENSVQVESGKVKEQRASAVHVGSLVKCVGAFEGETKSIPHLQESIERSVRSVLDAG